jgi:galactonate dehydratase
VTLDHDVIAANPRRQIFFNLFAENWHRRQAERSVKSPSPSGRG